MKTTKRNSIVAMLIAIATISLAIFASNTVSLTVTEDNDATAPAAEKWDPVGQNAEERYINVSAGANVELVPKTVHTVTSINATDIKIRTVNDKEQDDEQVCNTQCTIQGADIPHKLHRSGHYKLSSGSGVTGESRELVWNATGRTEGTFEIKSFDSVRRRYGDNDPGEVTKISVKGENGVVYKLKIEKISGEGDAAFDAAGTQKEMDYTGTGTETQLALYGVKESTAEHNIKITGTKDGALLDEQKFIVFSEIKIDWSSSETQHKDTEAPCTLCDNQPWGGPLWEGKEQHKHILRDAHGNPYHQPCNHQSFFGACQHCVMYCARCCMKVIKEGGCHQDDFRNYADDGRQMTVEENHGEFFKANFAMRYGFGQLHKNGQEVSYESVYKKLVEQKKKNKAIVRFATHCNNVAAIEHNMDNGTITPEESHRWDPVDASWGWRAFGGDLYLYLAN